MKGSLQKARLSRAELIGSSIIRELNNVNKNPSHPADFFIVRVRGLGWYRSLLALYQALVC